jgi:hypothetical protein
MRTGDAVLVFVTEPFSKSKQVKVDDPSQNPTDVATVLKLNFSKKFDTGIYPYSMMNSTFTPIEEANRTLKITSTIQEWCGHVFGQVNWKKNQYECTTFSYFENEGDQKNNIGNVITEDGIWNMIRIQPKSLPIGNFKFFPSLGYIRLKHKPTQSLDASATLSTTVFNQKPVNQYFIKYSDRALKIFFDEKFPHIIQGWEETYKDGTNELTTRGTLKKTILLDYWMHNTNADNALRNEFYK